MKRSAHSLRTQLVIAFGLFATASAVLLSVLGVIFVYTVEDSFFARMLEQEIAHQRSTWQASGKAAAPLRPFVTLHRSRATFPRDLDLGDRQGGEFMGEHGRHYHVRALALDGAAPHYLVADVSSELVVRPRLPSILSFLGVAILIVLALTLAVGYWLAARATAPLARLTGLVALATPGQLPTGFAQQFPDNEIGLLARGLDDAMSRIAGFIEREQHFTRDASHELRTPLTVIDGAAQLLAAQALPPQAAGQVQRIRSATTHMAQAVDTLLSLAREELDPAPPQPVALLPLVERAVVQCAHLLEGKAMEVSVELDPCVSVATHPASLAILLNNLIGNAFAHTREGRVTISFEAGSLVVADNGPGIAPALAARLYQPGVKGEASAGFGLGLSIASRLAERCGIRLEVGNATRGGARAALVFGEIKPVL